MNQASVLIGTPLMWQQGAAEEDSPPEISNGDYHLAQRVARGDMEAFEELYRLHHRRVYSLCFRMMRSVAEAEDLTQDIFIHLYRKIGSFRGESAFTTWLHRMTTNHVLMHFRKSRVRREQTTEDGELHQIRDESVGTQGQLMAVDRLALDSAIAQLPPGYRIVFVLHDVEGYEHKEIARMHGIAVGTSKSQLHKARMKLRTLLKEARQPQDRILIEEP
ncbi:MAG: RNA polymerase sigma factor [Pyrinomonadaceae bacterium]